MKQTCSQRSSKKIKINYKTLSCPQEPFPQTKAIHKKRETKKKTENYQAFSNSFFYPKPIQAMLKLKQKLSLLDINTISSVLRDPSSNEKNDILRQMNRLALDQEELVKHIIKGGGIHRGEDQENQSV
jgi:hypothetical protein